MTTVFMNSQYTPEIKSFSIANGDIRARFGFDFEQPRIDHYKLGYCQNVS